MSYTWEAIGGGLAVAVDEHCRISEDGVLLAQFAAPVATDTVCDLGTGNGILPLYWCRRKAPRHITAVEKEAAFLALANAAVERFSLQENITLLCADWRDTHAMPKAASMTVVTCNPPYFRYAASRQSPDALRRAARQEDHPQTLEQVCMAASRLLSENGRFCMCHRPDRLADVFAALAVADLTAVRLQFVQSREEAAPWLVLIEASKKGTLQVLSPLVQHQRGTQTAVYTRLYR